MTNEELKTFVKERNEALFSLDRQKIESYCIKYGEEKIAKAPDLIFWAAVYKAISNITGAPKEVVKQARKWLHNNGFSTSV